MKKIVFILIIALSSLFSGCKTRTGLVFVDKPAALSSGIKVTEISDNPVFANIKYDYSAIENFDESKVNVKLVFMPELYDLCAVNYDEVDEGNGVFYENPNKNIFLDYDFLYVNNIGSMSRIHERMHWKERGVCIVGRSPGSIKILSLDDIGKYVITYE